MLSRYKLSYREAGDYRNAQESKIFHLLIIFWGLPNSTHHPL
jgi:hypothetical protein